MEPIAIIGMSFKFPGGAETADEFWKMLVERRCAVTEFPKDRFNIDAFWHPDGTRQNIINTREGHFLDSDIKNFDAGFFSMAPHEAGSMDPQQRGLMETTYHAFENAGLRIEDVAGSKASVHIGCFTSDFATMQFRDAQNIPKYNSLGTAGAMLANRISWFYDLHGQSMYIDTACSSSLVALALACQGLASGESDLAVVGGSNIILIPEFSVSLSNMNMLSPSGRCHSFDAKADGYGRGEGFATLILKPVSKAIADGNPVRALIRSAGTNQDGHTSSGITQPSKDMQVQLIQETYRKAGLDMRHTRFFEAHGTGTAVGDPIEARAIGEAFFRYTSKEDPIYVGAVKSNVGHLEGTSGLAGVVKAVLALERGVIPPNTNFETINPQIDADFLNLRFPTECVPWPKATGIRRASVNSFGFGGSNSHVILEAADDFFQSIGHHQPLSLSLSILRQKNQPVISGVTHSSDLRIIEGHASSTNGHLGSCVNHCAPEVIFQPRLLILSASDEDGIARQARSLTTLLSASFSHHGDHDMEVLDDIIFTLNTRRTLLQWKSYSVLQTISSFEGLVESLSTPIRKPSTTTAQLGLVFTGQGAQWPRMGHELLNWPVFRSSLIRSQRHLDTMGCTWCLIDELAANHGSSHVNIPEFSQAMTTAIQIALVDLVSFLAMKPSVVVGHSSGEIAAAYCAGFLCHESAIRVSYFRGVLASKLARESTSSWGMASVGLPASELPVELVELQEQNPNDFDVSEITISCINSPTNTTVSGPTTSLDLLVSHLAFKSIFARRLKVDVGYHSPQMKWVASEYNEHILDLRTGEDDGRIKMVSTVLPGLVTSDQVCSGKYWVRNMVLPVRFSDAMTLCSMDHDAGDTIKHLDGSHASRISIDGWLEIGPHAALMGPLREIFESQRRADLLYTSLLVRNKPANVTVHEAIGQLFCRGFPVDLDQTAKLGAIKPREARIIVDLPEYPFNHSVAHWQESGRSRTFRSRAQRHHPLVGSQVIDWNPLDARWRLAVKKDDIPWVSDHRLHGSMWYPAAGMVVMAVEALKQLLPSDHQYDFELQNVTFTAPLVISETSEGTETQISMVPISKARGAIDTDYKFRIFAAKKDGTWTEVCDGTIAPQRTRPAPLDINTQDEEEYKRERTQGSYDKAIDSCQSPLDAKEMYQRIDQQSGLQYGPTFQGLTHVYYDRSGQAHGRLMPLEEAAAATSGPCTIHPATLDSIFQLAIPALSAGLTKPLPTLVPARLTRLWISREGAGIPPPGIESELEAVHAQARLTSKRSAVASMSVFSTYPNMQLRVQVEELESTEVAREQDDTASGQAVRSICHEMEWKVDPTLLDRTEMLVYCSRYRSTAPEPEVWYKGVRLMLLGFANQAVEAMRALDQTPLPSMRRYLAWLQTNLDAYWADQAHAYGPLPSGTQLRRLAEQFEATGFRGAVGALVGRQLRGILVGEVDPLQTLFADTQYLANIYEEVNKVGKAFQMLDAYVDALVHKEPGLKFLEIGAGTGATTSMILDMIADPEQGPRYAEYNFTDISGFFFSAAQERFKAYDRVQYRTLDIEKEDFGDHGFAEGDFDVIVAANVLHATRDLSVTLSNVRRLLKPHGKLILVEMTTPDNIETGFVWGSLPGWWLGSEDFRQRSAVVDEDRWDSLLKQARFSGTEQVFRDWDSDVCHGWSVMVSSATQGEDISGAKLHVDSTPLNMPQVTLIVDDESSELQMQTAKSLQREMNYLQAMARPELVTFEQVFSMTADLKTRHCILLVDMDRAHLHDTEASRFQSYQKVLTTCKSVLWVQMNDGQSGSPPYWAMVEGLSRVCRSENPLVKITTLILEADPSPSADRMSTLITKVMNASSTTSSPSEQVVESGEEEYREISGYLCVNRLRQAKYLDQHVSSRTQSALRPRRFGSGLPVMLNIRTPGLLDTLEWVEDKTAYSQLRPDQLEVQVRAIGVNFKDCLALLGRVNSDHVGSECAGYVSRVGCDVKRFKVGDRVAVGTVGTYRSMVRARDIHTVGIPYSMSFEDAAGVPTAFCTAYYSLYNVARLQRGETILIHAAAGGTGQAAVQIAQFIGAEIFATVGSLTKRDFLVEQYGIPEDHIFYSRNASFADGVKRMTKGRGVDVVLNSLSGKLLVASWEIIAEFGRFVEIGRKDIDTRGFLPMFPFIKNATFSGVDLAGILDGEGQGKMHILQDVFDLMQSGVLRPSNPVQPYPIDQAEQAFRLLVSGRSTGKIILTTDDDAMIMFRESDDSEYRFSNEATYVIAGGLGGIGRQITRWMVRRGAVNILLLTRSGSRGSVEKSRLISELEAQGINLQYGICDITNLESVREAVQVAAQTMPPIKGCFQAAMVIQDRTFMAMNHQDWCASVQPKVQGSWNLHATLPSAMDFFVMLSSAVCIFGNAGQANYAAGNTFQDALAWHRVANGEKAVAIDLGMVLDEGWVAERKHIHHRVMQFGQVLPVSQRELFALFDYYCSPATVFRSPTASQIVTGLELPALILRAGRQIPESMQRPLFRAMHQAIPVGELSAKATAEVQDAAAMFAGASTLAAAGAAVAECLKTKICKILGVEAKDKTVNDRMDSFGVDSLIALEVRNWLAKEMRADLAVYEILGDVRLIDTGIMTARKSEFRKAHWEHVSD